MVQGLGEDSSVEWWKSKYVRAFALLDDNEAAKTSRRLHIESRHNCCLLSFGPSPTQYTQLVTVCLSVEGKNTAHVTESKSVLRSICKYVNFDGHYSLLHSRFSGYTWIASPRVIHHSLCKQYIVPYTDESPTHRKTPVN